VECVDWTGGQIKNDDSSEDVKNVDLSQVHYLSGPIEIEGAKAGEFWVIRQISHYHNVRFIFVWPTLRLISLCTVPSNVKLGDLLKVEFLNLGPLDGDEWGFTGTFAKENGGGFLTDHFPKV
jgi:formamidase